MSIGVEGHSECVSGRSRIVNRNRARGIREGLAVGNINGTIRRTDLAERDKQEILLSVSVIVVKDSVVSESIRIEHDDRGLALLLGNVAGIKQISGRLFHFTRRDVEIDYRIAAFRAELQSVFTNITDCDRKLCGIDPSADHFRIGHRLGSCQIALGDGQL